MSLTKLQRRSRIKKRIRKVISGTSQKPRLSVFRSNKEIYAQLIDDDNSTTLATFSSKSKDFKVKGNKTEIASAVGKGIAAAAIKNGIKVCSFDRSGYLYHGRVKALAEAARTEGLEF